jgi:hypothetical protein
LIDLFGHEYGFGGCKTFEEVIDFWSCCSGEDIVLLANVIAERYKKMYGTGEDDWKKHEFAPREEEDDKKIIRLREEKHDVSKYKFLDPSKAGGLIHHKKPVIPWEEMRTKQSYLISLMKKFGVSDKVIEEAKKVAAEKFPTMPQVPDEAEIYRITKYGSRSEFKELMAKIREFNKQAVNVKMGL